MAPRSYRWLTLLVVAFLGGSVFAQTETSTDATGQRLLHLLDYVSVEYPEFVQNGRVVNAEEYAEQVEFAGQVEQMVHTLPAHPQRDAFGKKAAQLLALIQNKQDGRDVVVAARQLQQDLIGAYHIAVAPTRAPDVSAGAQLFATHCVACHGVNGDGAGPQATKSGSGSDQFSRGRAAESAQRIRLVQHDQPRRRRHFDGRLLFTVGTRALGAGVLRQSVLGNRRATHAR